MSPTRRSFLCGAGGSLALSLTGCSALNGNRQAAPGPAGPGGPEKNEVGMGLLASQSSAAAKIAEKDGYFAAQGLTVRMKVFASGPTAFPALLNGELDFVVTNYVSFFQAVAQRTLAAKIIANGNAATENSTVVMAAPDAGIAAPRDLVGKKVGIQQSGSVAELLLRATLQDHGVDQNSVRYLPIKFTDAAAAIASKQIDAAVEIEPFLTQAARTQHLVPVLSLGAGPTADMPLAGCIALDSFIHDHPKTVTAMQKALDQGQAAAADRAKLVEVLPELTGVDAQTVRLLAMDHYPTTLSAPDLQRAITLMQTYAGQAAGLRAETLIVPSPA
ncbi:ABC transporter substrate-binding protein [Amycolatopsis acidiphila]|nr:ABC transporter substrate-binding protein [Amycolatopsis acidiphila]UIJ57006.1 ABC transporter substrate-binding protein [Amycolatopsis acidiphila]GHG53871.1 sulfonate ABC transporter substrate-binding protein [Amycolatopsis acidiphila]